MGITLNPVTKIINITSPTTEVTLQELVNAIRDWEDSVIGMVHNKVIDAVGKADLGGNILTAITLTLSSQWQIQFWSGVSLGIVKEGNLVGGVGGQPIKPTGGDDTILIMNQVGGAIAVTGGSALTQEEHDWLEFVNNMEAGRWKMIDNQMIFYKADNVTEVARFDLKNIDGNPAMKKVVERLRV